VELTGLSLLLAHSPLPLSMVPRILIVDDEHDFIELLQYKLAGHGYELIVANDGVHALSQARTLKPNLILLDILLPDLDGLSVCEILRRQPATRKIPIIFMSALTGDVTKRTATMQADDFFTKPLDLNRLEKRIGELLHFEPKAN
jgi:DNA-binding response OmpR family regulator